MNRVRIVVALLVVLATASMARAERIKATLIGYQEVPSVSTPASGEFKAHISRDDGVVPSLRRHLVHHRAQGLQRG